MQPAKTAWIGMASLASQRHRGTDKGFEDCEPASPIQAAQETRPGQEQDSFIERGSGEWFVAASRCTCSGCFTLFDKLLDVVRLSDVWRLTGAEEAASLIAGFPFDTGWARDVFIFVQ